MSRVTKVSEICFNMQYTFEVYNNNNKKNVCMQRTTQRKIKLIDLSVVRSSVKEMLAPDVTLSADKTKLIARLVLREKGNIFWPIFQLVELGSSSQYNHLTL